MNDRQPLLKRIAFDLKQHWKLLIIILTPLILCPLPAIAQSTPASCAYVVLIMVIFWLTEVLPLGVTALIPLAMFPLFGILNAGKVSTEYLKDTNWVFVGSLMMALAVEKSELHHRIGLIMLLKIGTSPRRLMLGFMITTCILSCFMSNTATTAMMVPMVLAVMAELLETSESDKQSNSENANVQSIDTVRVVCIQPNGLKIAPEPIEKKEKEKLDFATVAEAIQTRASKRLQNQCKGLLLCICYSANIGGTGTLTGTTTNLVLLGQLNSIYGGRDTGLSYASWMAFSLPQMAIILLLAWLWLQFVYVGFGCCTKKQTEETAIKAVLERKYKELKPMNFTEIATLVIFIFMILLWLLRSPGFIPGWGDLFRTGYVTDGTASMIVAILLFVVPRDMPKLATITGKTTSKNSGKSLLAWDVMQKEFTWNIVLLVGGGYAMAAGVQSSGLDLWISRGLALLKNVPTYAFVTISVIMVTFITEFSSNVAIASIFVPIGASVANDMHVNPLYVTLPITIASSFAFMLPVATAPNAIVFGSRLIRVVDMAMAGFVMNIICMLILLININTYGCWLFQCHTFPAWAERNNASVIFDNRNMTA